MACTKCKQKQQSLKTISSDSLEYPFMADDITMLEGDEIRPMQPQDWPAYKHVLLVLIPEAFTPVCTTELGALNQWYDEFQKLECELIALSTDHVGRLTDWISDEDTLTEPKYMLLSSYLLPARLGLIANGKTKRASVFLMQDGEVVKQEHFEKVGRSFAELHRMLYGFTTGSYCAEGWQSPADGFLNKREDS